MNEYTVNRLEDTSFTTSQVFEMMRDAFKERLSQGLLFTCLTMSFDDFNNCTKNSKCIVAEKDGSLHGAIVYKEDIDKGNRRFAYLQYVAVKPDVKHCGVGTLLFKEFEREALSGHCAYLMSDTSTKAESAVKWHERNGFKKIGLRSFWSTNYYSYLFRKNLDGKYENDIIRRIVLAGDILRVKSLWKPDGKYTKLGSICHKIKHIRQCHQ